MEVSSVASDVSAPSDTTIKPESGNPASSSFARLSAAPSWVPVPLNDKSPGAFNRSVNEENRYVRTTNFSESFDSRGEVAAPKFSVT